MVSGSFDVDESLSGPDSRDFIPARWNQFRDATIEPALCTNLDESEDLRAEFVTGLGLLRLTGPKKHPKKDVVPQQLLVADALNGAARFFSLLMPRRSSKTTDIFAWALGRLESRSDFMIAYTMATTGLKARQRFEKDVKAPLEQVYPDEKNRPFKIVNKAGAEAIHWYHDDGGTSILQFVAPKGDSFRSDAWDVIIIDEAGEADPELTDDLLAGALATMDTRDEGLLIAAGTAGKVREGCLLWDYLQLAYQGVAGYGALVFAAPDGTTEADIDTWEKAAPLLLVAHPGIGNLTTAERIRGNYEQLRSRGQLETFLREYLSIFSLDDSASFLDFAKWVGLALAEPAEGVQPPKHFALSFAVHPTGSCASVAATWREDGKARALILRADPKTEWLYAFVRKVAAKYGVGIVHETIGSALVEAERLARAKSTAGLPKPKLYPQEYRKITTAAALFVKELGEGNIAHWNQDALNEAVRIATKRGQKDARWYYFGATTPEGDITSLNAVAMGLRFYDDNPVQRFVMPTSIQSRAA